MTVGDMMNAVEREFSIHRSRQRLIFKGRSLIDESAKLSSLGIEIGAKVMLIGGREVADPSEIRKLDELEVSLKSIQSQFASLEATYNCPTSSADHSVRKKQTKGIKAVTEQCMMNLEKADSIVLPDLIISAEELQLELDCVYNDPSISDSSK
ncbi:unnamed protein product [Hydatigera taeniaeformis]|uniref:Ubiquitin-like domain-containing protein n=1 Tax=Hydatigena taeniaeformis TaxID=6205 RepID=A0A3P7FUM7_HYDTA|nr:unnamed protein product [Hydatigera taeniaeformis]